MRRADRLLQIIQALRRARRPVTGQRLAEELEVSLRTVYRDMAALLASGVPVDGEAGIGYLLRAGYDLPPLMFTVEEIEAIVLGAQMVARTGDRTLSRAAEDAVAKIAHVLPDDLRTTLERTTVVAPGYRKPPEPSVDLALVRTAIRRERRVHLAYQDANGTRTERRIWPFALAFFTETAVIAAWCELRSDFRNFRADRIETLTLLDERYDTRRGKLLQEYLARMAQPPAD
jgi:predicted DNA-binding transcriptional regulator YafY